MARVLLINPSIKGSMYQTPCLGLGYIGASLKKAGHDVTVIDGCLSDVNAKRVIGLTDELRPDCIGVTAFTLQYVAIREIFHVVKQLNPHIMTVFGGQHASALTEYVMKENPEIDFTIKGEGEDDLVTDDEGHVFEYTEQDICEQLRKKVRPYQDADKEVKHFTLT